MNEDNEKKRWLVRYMVHTGECHSEYHEEEFFETVPVMENVIKQMIEKGAYSVRVYVPCNFVPSENVWEQLVKLLSK